MSLFANKEQHSKFPVDCRHHSPSQAMACFVLSSATLFSLVYACNTFSVAHHAHLTYVAIGLLSFKTLVEVGSSYCGFAFLFIGGVCLLRTERAQETKRGAQ